MSALGNDRFALKILSGYYVQFEIKDKEVTQLIFQQPNGNFAAKEKIIYRYPYEHSYQKS